MRELRRNLNRLNQRERVVSGMMGRPLFKQEVELLKDFTPNEFMVIVLCQEALMNEEWTELKKYLLSAKDDLFMREQGDEKEW